MTDPHQAVDDLRSFCQAADQVLTDGLRESANAYHDHCLTANQRLRRCEEFLRKGLRTEALQLAETEPPLLDTIAALDFPERDQWDSLAANYGITAAPRLNVATAEALNRAYAEQEPLQKLLREHRRLNISRAPLAERINMLRRLLGVDSSNPVWAEDIRAFEVVRHRELNSDVSDAVASKDFRKLTALWDEVETTPWIAAPPPQIVVQLQSGFLGQAAKEMYEAYQKQDFPRAQGLRDRFERMNPRSIFPPADPIWPRVELCLDWVRREESRRNKRLDFESAVLDLEQALSRRQTPEQLRELWGRIADFRIRIPTALEERYRSQMEEYRGQKDRKERLILALAFGGGATILALALLLIILRK